MTLEEFINYLLQNLIILQKMYLRLKQIINHWMSGVH